MVCLALCLLFTACGCSSSESTGEGGTSQPDSETLSLSSPAFDGGAAIPVRFANSGVMGGENVSIPLEWGAPPEGTASFALLMFDTFPAARDWVHWMVVDIPAEATGLAEGASGAEMPVGSIELTNSFGAAGYGGPEPPEGDGAHEYLIRLYALDVETLEIAHDADLRAFLRATDGHVLAEATYTGSLAR